MIRATFMVILVTLAAACVAVDPPTTEPPATDPRSATIDPSASRLELRVEPLVELYYAVRAQAATEDAEPAAGFEAAVDAARALQEEMGSWGGWGPLDSRVLGGADVDDLRAGFAELPEPYEQFGREISIRDDAVRLATALADFFPTFEREQWPARRATIEARIRRLETGFMPEHRRALAHMLESLGIRDPEIVAPMFLVTRTNPPGAMTYYLRGGAPASVLAVEILDTDGLLFETVLHETSHVLDMAAGDDGSAFATLRGLLEERGLGRRDRAYHEVPHTLMFVQAEETMRRLFDPEHVAYGDATDLYQRTGETATVERELWRRHLDGELSRDEALRRIVETLDPRP